MKELRRQMMTYGLIVNARLGVWYRLPVGEAIMPCEANSSNTRMKGAESLGVITVRDMSS